MTATMWRGAIRSWMCGPLWAAAAPLKGRHGRHYQNAVRDRLCRVVEPDRRETARRPAGRSGSGKRSGGNREFGEKRTRSRPVTDEAAADAQAQADDPTGARWN